MYYYKIFGLTVASEIRLPEAMIIEPTAEPEVSISFGEMPFDFKSCPETVWGSDRWYYLLNTPGRFLIHAGDHDFNVGRDGNIVIAEHGLGFEDTTAHTLLLGTVFGALHIQREEIVIHGAAIEKDGKAIIVAGGMGAGKSTVMSELIRRGYRYLADDVCAVKIERGVPQVMPAYPQRKLSADIGVKEGEDISSWELIREDGREKYQIRNHSEWYPEQLPLTGIVELEPVERENGGSDVRVQKIEGHEAMRAIIRNLYRPMLYQTFGIKPIMMKKILEIATAIRICRVERPNGAIENTVDVVALEL